MFVTVPNTFADAPAFAVARTVVPLRACKYPVDRASAIERTVKLLLIVNVLQVDQLSFEPPRFADENAQTLPVAHEPTE